jgi:TP901 family phage tail tape measure protein
VPNNNFRIVISGAYLDKTVYQDIVKGLRKFGDSIKIPINIDTKKLDKSLQSIKLIANEQGEVTNSTQKYNVELGKTLVLKTKIRNAIDAEGKLTKDINGNLIKEEITTSEILVNQKAINKEKEKELENIAKIRQQVKGLQGEYWQGRFQDSVQGMTQTPSGVNQLNSYYKQLEIQLGTVDQAQKKVNKSQAEYWANRRKEAVQGMTQKPQELQDMAKYYSLMEKESASVKTLSLELKKLQENAVTTNKILKNFGGHDLHEKANQLTSDLQKLNITQNMTQKEIQETIIQGRQLSNTLANVSREAKSTGNHSMTMGKMIGTAVEKFSIWMGVTGVFFALTSAIRNGIISIVDLDTSLTELNKVADLSNSQLRAFTDNAYEAGKTLGRTGKEVIDATTEFKRAGFTMQESFDLSQKALLLTNIGDGITDVKEAAGSIIAILRGYQMEASNTAHIVDLLNEVSNKYAVDTNNLTNGLQRASGTLSQTGTSVEELTGLLTGGYEALRNMEKVSTGLITISQRLRGVGEDGEEIDGLMPKLQKDFKEIADIDIQKTNGQLRSTYDIIKDLAKVWDTLNDEQRQRIGELASGVRQAPVLNAIIQNWKNVEGASEDAMNSLGSAVKENEKYLNSIGGKIKNFTSSVQMMWKNTIDSNTIKLVVDFARGIIEVVNSVGLLNIVLLTLSGFISGKFLLEIPLLTNFMVKLASSMGLATGAAVTLGAALSAILVVGAIIGLVKAFDALYVSAEEQAQKVAELTSKYDSLKSKVDELRQLKNPTAEEYLKSLEKELDVKEELLKIETQRALQKEMEGDFYNPWSGMKSQVATTSRRLGDILAPTEDLENRKRKMENDYTKEQLAQNEEYFKIGEQIEKNRVKIIEYTNTLIENKNKLEEYRKKMGDDFPESAQFLLDSINLNIEAVDRFGISIKDNTQSQKDNADAIYQYADQTEKFSKKIEEASSNADLLNKSMQELDENNSISGKTLTELLTKYPDLISYLGNEVELREQLKKKINEEKIAANDAYIEMIKNSEEFYAAKIKGTDTLYKALGKYYTEDLENAKSLAEAKLIVEKNLIGSLAKAWSQYYDAASGTKTAEYDELQLWAMQGNAPAGIKEEARKAKEIYDEFQNIKKAFDDIAIKSSNSNVIDFGSGKKKNSGSSGSSAASSVSEALIEKDRYNQLNYELERTNGLLEQNKALQENSEGEKLNQLLEQEIKLLEKKQDNLHAINDERRIERDELQKSLGKSGMKFSGSGDSLTLTNMESILNNKLTQVNAHRNDKNKTTYNKLKKEYEDLTKAVSRFIEIQTKEIPQTGIEWQRLQKEINSTKKSIEDIYQAQVDANAKVADEIIDTMKNAYETQRDFAIAAIDEELEALNEAHDEKLELLDEELSKYEDIIDAKLKSIEKQENEDDYNKQLEKVQKERQDTLNKINVLSLDDSFEAQSQVAELQKQLAEQDEQIAEMKLQRDRELRKENLQDQLDSYKDEIDAKKDTENKEFKITKDRLDKERKEIEEYYDEIIKNERYWAELRTQIINGETDKVKAKLAEFLTDFESKNKDTVRGLGRSWQELLNIIDDVNEATGKANDVKAPTKSHEYGMSDADYSAFTANGKAWEQANERNDKAEMDRLRAANDALRKKYGIPTGAYPEYKTGGYTGDWGSSEGRPAILHEKELVLNKFDTANLLKVIDVTRNLIDRICIPKLMPSFAEIGGGRGNVVYNLNMNIENLNGTKQAGQTVFKEIVGGLKKLGAKI